MIPIISEFRNFHLRTKPFFFVYSLKSHSREPHPPVGASGTQTRSLLFRGHWESELPSPDADWPEGLNSSVAWEKGISGNVCFGGKILDIVPPSSTKPRIVTLIQVVGWNASGSLKKIVGSGGRGEFPSEGQTQFFLPNSNTIQCLVFQKKGEMHKVGMWEWGKCACGKLEVETVWLFIILLGITWKNPIQCGNKLCPRDEFF